MAAAAAQYYFRFRICWCHCLQNVKVYQRTKFRRHISIHGWDITTSGLEKQTAAILEFYCRFRSLPFRRKCSVILHEDAELWRHIDFQDGGSQPCCIYFGVMADHPRSPFRGLNSVFKSLVRQTNSFGDMAMYRFWRFGLKLPIHAPFGEFLGVYFSHMISLIVQILKRTVLGRKHVPYLESPALICLFTMQLLWGCDDN